MCPCVIFGWWQLGGEYQNIVEEQHQAHWTKNRVLPKPNLGPLTTVFLSTCTYFFLPLICCYTRSLKGHVPFASTVHLLSSFKQTAPDPQKIELFPLFFYGTNSTLHLDPEVKSFKWNAALGRISFLESRTILKPPEQTFKDVSPHLWLMLKLL